LPIDLGSIALLFSLELLRLGLDDYDIKLWPRGGILLSFI